MGSALKEGIETALPEKEQHSLRGCAVEGETGRAGHRRCADYLPFFSRLASFFSLAVNRGFFLVSFLASFDFIIAGC